jgi:dUTP pyrophosphatase
MKVRIKRFDTELPLPEYKTSGAVACDLTARIEVSVPPKDFAYIPLNVAIEIPEGYTVLLIARSGTHKRGLMLLNGVGVFDSDFAGDGDEYVAVYFNFTENPVIVERGERIAQALMVKREKVEWEEVDHMPQKTRGKFGSTGHK